MLPTPASQHGHGDDLPAAKCAQRCRRETPSEHSDVHLDTHVSKQLVHVLDHGHNFWKVLLGNPASRSQNLFQVVLEFLLLVHRRLLVPKQGFVWVRVGSIVSKLSDSGRRCCRCRSVLSKMSDLGRRCCRCRSVISKISHLGRRCCRCRSVLSKI